MDIFAVAVVFLPIIILLFIVIRDLVYRLDKFDPYARLHKIPLYDLTKIRDATVLLKQYRECVVGQDDHLTWEEKFEFNIVLHFEHKTIKINTDEVLDSDLVACLIKIAKKTSYNQQDKKQNSPIINTEKSSFLSELKEVFKNIEFETMIQGKIVHDYDYEYRMQIGDYLLLAPEKALKNIRFFGKDAVLLEAHLQNNQWTLPKSYSEREKKAYEPLLPREPITTWQDAKVYVGTAAILLITTVFFNDISNFVIELMNKLLQLLQDFFMN